MLWFFVLVFGILLKYFGVLFIGSEDIGLVVSIIIVLIVRSLIHLILNPLSSIPVVLKKPHFELYWSLSSVASICILIYLFRGFDFVEMFYGYATLSILSLVVFVVIILRMVRLPLWSFAMTLWRGFVCIFPLLIVLFLPSKVLLPSAMWLFLFGVLYSVMTLFFFEKAFFVQFWKRLRS